MARLAAYEDTTMPIADTMGELWANQQLYGVIGGCAVALDAANLTADIAVGAVYHNGIPVAVAAQVNIVTLVADSANPRWSWIAVDSSGVGVLVSGTPAATPTIPELGDYVPLMLVYVAAGATIASAQTNYDQRVPITSQTWRSTANFTKNNNVTLGDVTGLKGFIGASEVWAFTAFLQLTTVAAADIKMAFTLPAGATATGNYSYQTGAGVLNARVSDWTASQSMATAAAGVGAVLSGVVVNGTTAGSAQLQAAQDTLDVSDTIIYAQSFIVWRRLA